MNKIKSVFESTSAAANFQSLKEDTIVDAAIIGGGITGITAAYLLSKQGKSVAVLEAHSIGKGLQVIPRVIYILLLVIRAYIK